MDLHSFAEKKLGGSCNNFEIWDSKRQNIKYVKT